MLSLLLLYILFVVDINVIVIVIVLKGCELSESVCGINTHLLQQVDLYLSNLRHYFPLAKVVETAVKGEADFSPLLDPFPRPRSLSMPREEVAGLIVHSLLVNNMELKRLGTELNVILPCPTCPTLSYLVLPCPPLSYLVIPCSPCPIL